MSIKSGSIYLATHITDRVVAIVDAITLANGKRTDIGKHGALINVTSIDLPEYPGVIVSEGSETGLDNAGGLMQTEMEIFISAWDKEPTTEAANHPERQAPHVVMGNMICDIRESMEPAGCARLADMSVQVAFVGATRHPPEQGGEVFGVEVVYNVIFSCIKGEFDRTP